MTRNEIMAGAISPFALLREHNFSHADILDLYNKLTAQGLRLWDWDSYAFMYHEELFNEIEDRTIAQKLKRWERAIAISVFGRIPENFKKCYAQLDDKKQSALYLRYACAATYTLIGAELGIAKSTAKTLCDKSVKAIKELVESSLINCLALSEGAADPVNTCNGITSASC